MSLPASRQTKSHTARAVQGGDNRILSPAHRLGEVIQALSLYVSAAVATFGWGTSRLLDFDSRPYLFLWFAGSLLVYNVDRLKPDPADPVNIPGRHAAFARLKRPSRGVIAMALLTLIVLPVSTRNWWLLTMTVAAAFVCICYSLRPLGFRFKDIPLLKSFFAPTIAIAAFVFPPLWHGSLETHPCYTVATTFWLWMFLCFNMILCDLRDIEGDRLESTLSLPVLLGARNTRFILWLLVAVTLVAGLFIGWTATGKLRHSWITLALGAAVYQSHLLGTPEANRNEAYFEWRVEGMLFLPAVAMLVCRS
jgi:4-hydroxybenzoate polyprenyltransferase